MLMNTPQELRAVRSQIFISKFMLVTLGFVMFSLVIYFLFFQGASLGLLVAPLVGWIGGHFWSKAKATKVMAELLKMQKAVQDRLLAESGGPSYFTVDIANSPCGIAANPEKRTLTAVTWTGPVSKKELAQLRAGQLSPSQVKVTTLAYDEILKWSAVEPASQVVEAVGSLANISTSDLMAQQRHNNKAQRDQRNGTGLFIDTNRLDCPEIFVNLNFEEAKPWVLMLSKLSNGTLPQLKASEIYPLNA